MRNHVLFVLDIGSCRVQDAGITAQQDGEWMTQVARDMTDCVDGFLKRSRYLILERDPLYKCAFRQMLKDAGLTPRACQREVQA